MRSTALISGTVTAVSARSSHRGSALTWDITIRPIISGPLPFDMGVFDNTFGAWYIGQQVALLLVGASVVQSWVFLKNCGQDPVLLKAVVMILMVLQLVQGGLVAAGLYHFLVSSIGNPEALMSIPRTLYAEPFIAASIIALVQWFYAFRIFRLTKSIPLVCIVVLLASAQLAMGSAAAAADLSQTETIVSSATAKNIACACLVADMVNDAIIAVTIVHFLRTHRTSVKSTESIMSSLTNYTLASGFTTFVGSCLVLSTFLAYPTSQIYSGISFVLPHLYTNSLLALLNARRSLRERSVGITSPDAEQNGVSRPFFMPWNVRSDACSAYTSTEMNIELSSSAPRGGHVLNLLPSHSRPNSEETKKDMA